MLSVPSGSSRSDSWSVNVDVTAPCGLYLDTDDVQRLGLAADLDELHCQRLKLGVADINGGPFDGLTVKDCHASTSLVC